MESLEKNKILKNPKSIKDIAFGMFVYSSSSIFGPLVLFLLLGYLLDKYFQTKPVFLIIGVAIAFVLTNILIYKKIKILTKDFNNLDENKLKIKQDKNILN